MARKTVYTEANKALCRQLVAARHAASLSQQQLADKLGRHQSYIAKYECGERRIDLIELVAIAKVLRIDLGRLLRQISPLV